MPQCLSTGWNTEKVSHFTKKNTVCFVHVVCANAIFHASSTPALYSTSFLEQSLYFTYILMVACAPNKSNIQYMYMYCMYSIHIHISDRAQL